jgi:hypothetical protein
MSVFDKEKLIKMLHGQAKSADLWIGQWERYKDVSGVRNAALAIGKMFGLYHALCALNGMDEDVPEEILELMRKYNAAWDNLHISKEIAAAISVHG